MRGGECSIGQPLELAKHTDKSLNVTGKNVLNLLPSVRNIDYNMMQHIRNVIKLYVIRTRQKDCSVIPYSRKKIRMRQEHVQHG